MNHKLYSHQCKTLRCLLVKVFRPFLKHMLTSYSTTLQSMTLLSFQVQNLTKYFICLSIFNSYFLHMRFSVDLSNLTRCRADGGRTVSLLQFFYRGEICTLWKPKKHVAKISLQALHFAGLQTKPCHIFIVFRDIQNSRALNVNILICF